MQGEKVLRVTPMKSRRISGQDRFTQNVHGGQAWRRTKKNVNRF